MEISVIGNKLVINDKLILFKYEIEKYLVLEGIVIVLIRGIEPDNIYGIDESGKILWQIEKHIFIWDQDNCIYTDISLFENKLASYNFCGFFCIVNHRTGKLISVEFSK